MKFGLFAPLASPFATPEYITAFGEAADEYGIDSLWLAEHVVLFDEYDSPYPYAADGKIPAPPDAGILDPLDTICFLAGCTERVRLATGICLLPQRNPVYTAKHVATADWLSQGRVDFGVGIGWLREEFEALQVSWPNRGRRADDYIGVLKTLWCDEVSEFEGDFYTLPPCRQYPKPVQHPHPPIHVGGESDAALRRAARLGQGWHGFGHSPESAGERIEKLEGFLAEEGRDRSDFVVTISPYLSGIDPDKAKAYAEAGADQVVAIALAFSTDAIRPALDGLVPTIEAARAS
jgi:probable F420-dependent oxidoreductase